MAPYRRGARRRPEPRPDPAGQPAPERPCAGHRPGHAARGAGHLAPATAATYLDGTFGGGGYAAAILEAARCTVWAIDRDPDAIARGAALAARFPGRLHLLHGRFGDC